MKLQNCTECGMPHTRGKDLCFRCHIQGVSFGFVGGGGYGRESFHNYTIGERIRENVGEDYKTNPNVEHVQEGWS